MTKVTRNVENQFLKLLAEGKQVKEASDQVGVSRKTMYAHRSKRPKFKEAWDDAIEDARLARVVVLEKELYRRAVEGVPVGTFRHRGKTYLKMRLSDALLLAMLKAEAPEKYGDKPKEEEKPLRPPSALMPRVTFVKPSPPPEEDAFDADA